MKISSRHIWKTVNEAGRHQAELRNQNLHIGRTMRELQQQSEQKYNKPAPASARDVGANRTRVREITERFATHTTTGMRARVPRRGTNGANRRFCDNNKRRGGGIHGRWECELRRPCLASPTRNDARPSIPPAPVILRRAFPPKIVPGHIQQLYSTLNRNAS